MFCNHTAAHMLGFDDPGELLGKNMHTTEHHTRADGTPYPLEECPIYIGFQNGLAVHRDDEVYWRKDGTCFPVEFWSHPVFREGKTVGAVITFVDITERKQAEEALRKSEQLKRSLLDINNAIITNLTEEALLRSISEAVRPLIASDRCSITLYKPETHNPPLSGRRGTFALGLFPVWSGGQPYRNQRRLGVRPSTAGAPLQSRR
jgi:formate hydrogenlyase transcriptional activator